MMIEAIYVYAMQVYPFIAAVFLPLRSCSRLADAKLGGPTASAAHADSPTSERMGEPGGLRRLELCLAGAAARCG